MTTTRGVRPAIVAALALVCSLATACSHAAQPIVVGAVYPLSGTQGSGGMQEYRGVRLATDMVNAAGGVGGRAVRLRPVDAATSDAAAPAVSLLDRESVRFVLGSYGSTISAPAADEAARRGMLFWETGAVGEMTGRAAGDLVFRMAPTGGVLGRDGMAFLLDQLLPRLHRSASSLRFAVASVDDVYGESVARGAVDELRARGLRPSARFRYDPHTFDPDALAGRIARAHPDVLYVSAYLQDGVALRRATVRAGLPLVASIGSSSSYCMARFGARLGADALGLFASDKPDAGSLNPTGLAPEARRLLATIQRLYRNRYGESMTAPALAGFSAAWALFHDVMPAASAITPTAVADQALATRIPRGGLPNGSGLELAPAGSPDAGANVRAASVIWEWTRVGRREVVWPPEYATGPIRTLPLAG